MKRSLELGLFLVLCVAQLLAAASGIAKYENTLADGTPYRFQCAPLDPEDPFRGRYVRLQFRASQVQLPLPSELSGTVYAVLGSNEEGYAVFTELRTHPPKHGDYLLLHASKSRSGTFVHLPFDRYFMEESKAPKAEQAYWRSLRDGNTYLEVRVLDGQAVTEGLFIEGIRIEEVVEQM